MTAESGGHGFKARRFVTYANGIDGVETECQCGQVIYTWADHVAGYGADSQLAAHVQAMTKAAERRENERLHRLARYRLAR